MEGKLCNIYAIYNRLTDKNQGKNCLRVIKELTIQNNQIENERFTIVNNFYHFINLLT